MRLRTQTVMFSVAALTACSHAPLAPEATTTPDAAAHLERSWADPAVRATWRVLGGEGAQPANELTVTETLAGALTFSPQVALARAQADAGRAGVLIARQRPNPVLALTPERALNAAAGVSPWVVALSLVWPMQTAGKRTLAIEQALAASDVSLLTAANLVWNLRASSRSAVCGVEFAAARNSLVRDEFAMRADLATRLDKQADAGIVSRYEAARAHLERDSAAQRARQTETELNGARHDLAAIAGLPFAAVEARAVGSECLAARPRASEDTAAAAAAIGARLDLRAKLAEFRSTDAAWRLELHRRIPDLNLGPGYTFDQGTRKITFTVSGELPIFSHNQGAIARARADRDRTVAETEILQDSVLNAVARASDQLRAAESQCAAAESAAELTQQLLDRDVERQASGEIDQPAVIVARIGVVGARADVLNAQRAVGDAIAALEGATQVPLVPPFFDGPAAQAMLMPDPARSP